MFNLARRQKVNAGALNPTEYGLKSLIKTIKLSDFTDGGGASGTVTLTEQIPAGAVVQRTMINDVTGFIGNVSAVITIGDGTDTDRYNTGTPSVFTTASSIDAGAVSGTAYHTTAKQPVVTVTSGTDFGAVTDGKLTVIIHYYI